MKKSAFPNRFAGLDHLRALAIILVFVYHSGFIGGRPPSLDAIGEFGWTGVDLFFVLSGYLIGGQLLARVASDQSISYGEFYIKRSLRILPAYFVVLALYVFIPGFRERSELPPLWRFLTFTQNYGLDLVHQGAFSHAWSLCIEEQFYLGLPLFILALTALGSAHRAVWILPALFLLGFGLRLFNWYHFLEPILQTPGQNGFSPAYYKWIYYPTYTRLDGLLAGELCQSFVPRSSSFVPFASLGYPGRDLSFPAARLAAHYPIWQRPPARQLWIACRRLVRVAQRISV